VNRLPGSFQWLAAPPPTILYSDGTLTLAVGCCALSPVWENTFKLIDRFASSVLRFSSSANRFLSASFFFFCSNSASLSSSAFLFSSSILFCSASIFCSSSWRCFFCSANCFSSSASLLLLCVFALLSDCLLPQPSVSLPHRHVVFLTQSLVALSIFRVLPVLHQ